MSLVTEKLDLPSLNQRFDASDPAQVVQWAAAQFGEEMIMSSSFGAESALLIHMTIQHLPNIKIIFVDTGYLFPETYGFMEQLRLRFNLNVWTYRTRNDPIAYLHRAGEENPTWRKDVNACCAANKIEPFTRAIAEIKPRAWLRGIRHDQTGERKNDNFFGWSARDNCYTVSPLLKYTSREIHAYMKRHDLPYHPLWEKGYTSIGCNPISCTAPVELGVHPRSGRWAGTGKTECGINVTNSLDSANL